MSSVNKVMLIGNLGNEPEIKELNSGKKVANFSLATSESYFDEKAQEKRTLTDWHKVSVWGGLAEVVEKYLSKGSKVYIEGKLKHKSYENESGEKKYFTEVQTSSLVMLGSKPSSNNFSSNVSEDPFDGNEEKDDLPF